jgi:uncharacterized lipoprotein YmbA
MRGLLVLSVMVLTACGSTQPTVQTLKFSDGTIERSSDQVCLKFNNVERCFYAKN